MAQHTQKNDDWSYYRFCRKYDIAIRTRYLPRNFYYEIKPFKVSHAGSPKLELVLCRSVRTVLKQSKQILTGRYKGIPWKMAVIHAENHAPVRVYFFSQLFCGFLAIRMILIPFLKRQILSDGGFTLIGSAFEYEGKRFVLFGYPGCGKTKLLLQAAQRGARLLGDSELYFTQEGEIGGIFKYLELRFRTARDTRYFERLTTGQRMKLWLYDLFSSITLRKISLNMLFSPEQIGVSPLNHSSDGPVIFVSLGQGRIKVDIDEMVNMILCYEKKYQKLFKSIFFNEEDLELSRRTLASVLSRYSLWELSSSCLIEDVLALE